MSAVLKNLGRQQHGHISLKAFLDHRNYCEPGLMSEDAITERILKTMRREGLTERDMRAAIKKGFHAAKRTPETEPSPEPHSESVAAETENSLPNNGLAEARLIARSRRSLWAIRNGVAAAKGNHHERN